MPESTCDHAWPGAIHVDRLRVQTIQPATHELRFCRSPFTPTTSSRSIARHNEPTTPHGRGFWQATVVGQQKKQRGCRGHPAAWHAPQRKTPDRTADTRQLHPARARQLNKVPYAARLGRPSLQRLNSPEQPAKRPWPLWQMQDDSPLHAGRHIQTPNNAKTPGRQQPKVRRCSPRHGGLPCERHIPRATPACPTLQCVT